MSSILLLFELLPKGIIYPHENVCSDISEQFVNSSQNVAETKTSFGRRMDTCRHPNNMLSLGTENK